MTAMPQALIGVAIVVGVLLLVSAILGLVFFVSQAATSGLRAHYPATGKFDGPQWTLGYVQIGFMTYKNLVRVGASAGGLHIFIPAHQAIAIPWSELSLEPRTGFSFLPMVTLRAGRVPGQPIVILVRDTERLRELAGPAWPKMTEAASPAVAPYDSNAAASLKKLGSPWSRPRGDR